MTTAEFVRAGNGFTVNINGHADAGNGGPDTVCAACSALVCTLIQCLMECYNDGALLALDTRKKAGDCLVRGAIADGTGRVDVILHTIQSGFALLEKAYPAHVRLKI